MTYATLIETLMTNGEITENAARQVITAYRKAKVLKFNAHDGYQIVHGGLFDRDVIRRVPVMGR